MFKLRLCLILIVLVITALYVFSAQADINGAEMKGDPIDELLSEEKTWRERNEIFQELGMEYNNMQRKITRELRKAAREHGDNKSYMSPLHALILTTEVWRVYEARNTLFSIIDYRLDTASVPLGIVITGDFYYPAARALVQLRVEPRDVINAIVTQAANEDQLKLMTWVLYERVGNVGEVRKMLEPSIANENIKKAIEILDAASEDDESPSLSDFLQ